MELGSDSLIDIEESILETPGSATLQVLQVISEFEAIPFIFENEWKSEW